MQINSILKITEKFQTNSEFKVIADKLPWSVQYFTFMMTFLGNSNKLRRFSNIRNLLQRAYNRTLSEVMFAIFWYFAVKVNKKCNLIKRRWWLHAYLTQKSVGLLYYTVQGNMVSTLWLISDLFSQGIWWNKSEVLIIKSKITDHWKAGQKVNSVRHNVGLAWFDHSGCALQ